MDAELKEELTSELAKKLSPDERVLGAKLGQVVSKFIGKRDLKKEYHGLRPFVEQELAPLLRWDGRTEVDDFYRYNDSDKSDWHALVDGDKTLWWIFSNPNANARLAVTNTGEIRFSTSDSAALPEGFHEVSTLSRDDSISAIRSFIDTNNLPPRISDAFERDKNWLTWQKILRNNNQAMCQKWECYRIDNIVSSFSSRIAKFEGVDDNVRNTLVARLKKEGPSRQRNASREDNKRREDNNIQRHANLCSITENEKAFRNAIKRVVDKLSIDDLRSIWLPTGMLMDALTSEPKDNG